MKWRVFFRSFVRTLFILYCIEAGVFLVLLPWKEAWEQIVVALPLPALRGILIQPLSRAAVTGFGLVHLVWGAHDLEDLLMRRRARRSGTEGDLVAPTTGWKRRGLGESVEDRVEETGLRGVKGSRGL